MKKSMIPMTFLLAIPLGMAGCQSVECGPGSVQQGDQCVASQLAIVCGAGTEEVEGKCVAKDPAAADADWGFCGGVYADEAVVDSNGVCQPAGGNAGANAVRITTMVLSKPVMFAADANSDIATDLTDLNSLTYVGVYHIHREGATDFAGTALPDNPYRIWSGVDKNPTDELFALDPAVGAEAAATVAAGVLTSEKADFPIQFFGSTLVLKDATITEATVDETGAFAQVPTFRLKGVITPENAADVTFGPSTPLTAAISDAPDVGTGWSFDAIITAAPETVADR